MLLTRYPLLPVAALAACLAGCSSDQSSRTTAQPTPAAAALPAAPASAPPASPATAGAARAIAAAPVAAPKPSGRAVATPATPNAAMHTRPRPSRWVSRTPQPEPRFAEAASSRLPVTGSPPLSEGEKTLEVPLSPPAVAATDSDLRSFCAQAAPAGQVFQLRPERDTVLLGARGTRLVIPARAFEVPVGSRSVQLTLREFYSTPDIVLAGLGTRTSTNDLLETGGMLHLYAAAAGQTVHLRPGMRILVQLPTTQPLPGMQLYEGVSADVSHAPLWQLAGAGSQPAARGSAANPGTDPAALDRWIKLHPPKSPRWPRFEGGDNVLFKDFGQLMPDSKADQARLRRKRTIGKQEQHDLRELSRLNHTAIRHAIDLAVELDSTGTLSKAEPLAGDSVLTAEVLAAVRKLPAQQPASFISRLPRGRRTVSAVQGTFSVLYARSGKRLIGFHWLLMDKQLKEELAIDAQRNRVEFAREFASSRAPLTLSTGLYYELAAGGLGWINCDRLLEAGPRIQFAVQAPDSATVISLVFKAQRSILASSRTEGSTAFFEQVPAGAAATIVALRREKGITYLATSSVSLQAATQPPLAFHPVTLEQLRTELAQL